MKYEKGKNITDNCQYKKGRKYISESNVVFEFSHIGENGSPYFKDEGQGYFTDENEYNCIGFDDTDFYEAIEVTPELPDEGLVVFKKRGYSCMMYRTGKDAGYGFFKGEFCIKDGNGIGYSFHSRPQDWRPATPEEELKFTELLKKECERRGLYEHTKIKAHAGTDAHNINKSNFIIHTTLESAWNKNGCIFRKGKFAEPLEVTATLDEKITELIELGRSKGLKINVTFKQ